jgi:hypothetical protein
MRKAIVTLFVSLAATSGNAQGLVNFFNNSTTLISMGFDPVGSAAQPYYFGLLAAPPGTADPLEFTFTGVYGTNQAAAGRFSGGSGRAVNGWAPVQSRSFLVAGWSAELGHDFNPDWLRAYFGGPPWFPSLCGISGIGTGVAGGFDGTSTFPNLMIFGAAPSITSGFNLIAIPEPSGLVLALAGVCAAAFGRTTAWRGRKRT